MTDPRINKIAQAVSQMQQGNYSLDLPKSGDDDIARLAQAVAQLGKMIEERSIEEQTLMRITEKINAGIVLEEILNYAYEALRPIIPYDRIGFSLLEEDGELLRAVWARSDAAPIKLGNGYCARMAGSSLQQIILTGRPRILNDLPQYLKEHPQSESTRTMVAERMRSSLTCPLLARGKPIGFIFFSSQKAYAYQDAHVEIFMQIANQLSIIAEKSRLYQRLVELNDLKNKFLGIAAHDLRSPLTVIKGHLDLLKDKVFGELSPAQNESVIKMLGFCDNMLKLINDLLDISAIESGVIELRRQEVSLKEFLEHCVEFNHLLAKAKNSTLKTVFAANLPTIRMDPDRMTQVMNNLISNALKFSKLGTTVTISALLIGPDVAISVADHGQGIPQNELPKIFDFFSKTTVRPIRGESSTGLGLAIVKRMVEAHGGKIQVESQVNVGTTFTIMLPLAA